MECLNPTATSASPYDLLFRAASLIPISHYLLWFLLIFLVFMYNFLEFHLLEDLVTGFRGNPVSLTFSSCSEIYDGVVSKCRILHGRYLPTLWLSSPHLQTTFLNFLGRPPVFRYKRQLFHLPDGGTIALDWLKNSDVLGGHFHVNNNDTTPIVVVIPGLTSDSTSAYLMHFAFNMAKGGWNVVVSNHRGLGGVSVTSDCFYNAGWTEDIRKVIDYLHHEYPEAPLFAVGTSIGANILVKYLGEDGDNTPVAGAAAVSSPWDLLIGDRFISRRLAQKFYDRALTIGLQGYAKLHQPIYSRLADWEGIKKSRSIRDFDNYATCHVGKFETVDTYYRRCSSSGFVGNVSVPLLCINALDDPVCTREAIPWDECRANENIVLATTKHGGHLAFFEGITADCLWWVGAVNEFLGVLNSSPFIHRQKKMESSGPLRSLESSIDQGPFVNVTEDGMVAAVSNEQTANDIVEDISDEQMIQDKTMGDIGSNAEHNENKIKGEKDLMNDGIYPSKKVTQSNQDINHQDVTAPFRRCIDQLSRHNRRSLWLLAYIAIVTTWPFVGSTILSVFRRKLKNFSAARLLRGQ